MPDEKNAHTQEETNLLHVQRALPELHTAILRHTSAFRQTGLPRPPPVRVPRRARDKAQPTHSPKVEHRSKQDWVAAIRQGSRRNRRRCWRCWRRRGRWEGGIAALAGLLPRLFSWLMLLLWCVLVASPCIFYGCHLHCCAKL